jgi:hypothetical protein
LKEKYEKANNELWEANTEIGNLRECSEVIRQKEMEKKIESLNVNLHRSHLECDALRSSVVELQGMLARAETGSAWMVKMGQQAVFDPRDNEVAPAKSSSSSRQLHFEEPISRFSTYSMDEYDTPSRNTTDENLDSNNKSENDHTGGISQNPDSLCDSHSDHSSHQQQSQVANINRLEKLLEKAVKEKETSLKLLIHIIGSQRIAQHLQQHHEKADILRSLVEAFGPGGTSSKKTSGSLGKRTAGRQDPRLAFSPTAVRSPGARYVPGKNTWGAGHVGTADRSSIFK